MEIVGYSRRPHRSAIISIEYFCKAMDEGLAGDNLGVMLRNVGKDDCTRGHVLSSIGNLTVHRNFVSDIYVLQEEEGGRNIPFKTNYKPQFYVKTSDVAISLTLPENVEMANPGDKLTVTGHLDRPLPIKKGENFVLREGGKTVATGVIKEISPDTEEDFKEDEIREAGKKKKKSK